MFNKPDPTVKRLQQELEQLKKQIRELNVKTQRSEYTGGVTSYTFASLPTPNHAGMLAYCENCRKSGEGAGTGTGVLVVVTLLAAVLTWVRADDMNSAAAV